MYVYIYSIYIYICYVCIILQVCEPATSRPKVGYSALTSYINWLFGFACFWKGHLYYHDHMYYEGLVERWWGGDGDKCPIHKANYLRDTRNGM